MKLGTRRWTVLSLALASLALLSAVAAFGSSHWCVGSHRAVKPLCLSATRGGECLDPAGGQEQANVSEAGSVRYVWETGDDRYALRAFHTGFWVSCEEVSSLQVKCRSFLQVTPESEQGVLWFAIVAETLNIALLAVGHVLLCTQRLPSAHPLLAPRINSMAALFIVLSGIVGMLGHIMFTMVLHITVSLGPNDWKPQSWNYGWSFLLAWFSFSCTMASAVSCRNSCHQAVATHRRATGGLEASPFSPRLLLLDPSEAPFLWESSAFSTPGAERGGDGASPTACGAFSPC
ncbi:germ cell-specific gene 1-like protein isoform X1 [Narcine bancroftii]|uniref:germ cell-specific gene 1-like protein isoform X1 n=1 Tax=Narcine bancroftii TaxID=1343680 RepID=UPI003831B7FC